MAEIAFERLLVGLETARGTAQADPTRLLNMIGTLTPMKERWRPEESRGQLVEYYRSADTRKWAELEAEGPLDIYTLPLLLNAIVAGGIDGTGTTDATLTTDLTGDNNDIVYTAVTGGGAGNEISVQYIDPAANSSPLNVDVWNGQAIKIYLATDGAGAITSTGDDIKTAIEAHPIADALVEVADAAANDGSGLVTAMDTTYLSGGAGATVTTPGGGTDSRLWTFAPDVSADTLDSFTCFAGDSNVQWFRGIYGLLDELTISADATSTDGATMAITGHTRFPSKTDPDSIPSQLAGPLMHPSGMQLWIDTATIGSTALTGRVLGAEITLASGVTYKWNAAGPTATLDYQAIGRGRRHAELKLTLELPDTTQYDQWVAETSLMTRLRINGPLIEGALYYYFQFDIYGPFDSFAWGEHEGTNRTLEVTILSEYNAAAGYDYCVYVQTDRDAL